MAKSSAEFQVGDRVTLAIVAVEFWDDDCKYIVQQGSRGTVTNPPEWNKETARIAWDGGGHSWHRPEELKHLSIVEWLAES